MELQTRVLFNLVSTYMYKPFNEYVLLYITSRSKSLLPWNKIFVLTFVDIEIILTY